MATKYNPYNDYRKIVGYKGDWHNAQSLGQDPGQYKTAAMPYYQSLVNNGYEQLADDLYRSDYTTAKGLRDKYGLKEDNEFFLDQDYAGLTGEVPVTQNTPASDIINASHPNDSSINNLMNMGTGTTGFAQQAFDTAQGIATGAIPIQPSAATQGLLNSYQNSDQRLNGEIKYDANGNVVQGLNTEHYNIGRNQLDYYNNFDITKQPYYEGIMQAYQLGGRNAANNAYAEGASGNGGNIDSYAAANANRQQLAFTTAGQQAALAVAQQNAANWNNLYSQMSSDLDNQGKLSLETLKVAKDMYAKDADERMNALDNQGALASDQMANSIAALEKMVEERMKDKGISAEMAMKEQDIANEQRKLEMEIARDLEMNVNDNERAKYVSDNELTGTMYKSDNDLKGTMYTSDNDLRGTMYKSDNDLTGTMYKADADLAGTNIKAQADMYGSDRDAYARVEAARQAADATRYSADRDYDLGQSELENAIKKIYAQGDVDQNQIQWYLDNGYTLNDGKWTNGGMGNTGTKTKVNADGTVEYDPAELAQAFVDMIAKGDTKNMAIWGLDKVGSVKDLSSLLHNSYNITGDKLTEFYKALDTYKKNWGYSDTDALLADLEQLIPGITNTYKSAVGSNSHTTNSAS